MQSIPDSLVVGVEKGGVAMTALATALSGVWAAEHALRVLLVDADPQADATLAMGVTPAEKGDGGAFVDAVVHGDPLKVVAVRDRVDLVAAGPKLSGLAHALVTDSRAADKFAAAFDTVADRYDRVVLDLPPAAGASAVAAGALAAGACLIAATTGHPHDVGGIRVLGDNIVDADSDVIVVGVVLYKISAAAGRSRHKAHQKVRQILSGAGVPFDTIVRLAPKAYADALEAEMLIHEHLAWAETKTIEQRKAEGIQIARNLPDVVAEFRDLAQEINQRMTDIERITGGRS